MKNNDLIKLEANSKEKKYSRLWWKANWRWITKFDYSIICYYMSELGISEDEVICGAISLGYSKQSNMNPLQRKGNPMIFVK